MHHCDNNQKHLFCLLAIYLFNHVEKYLKYSCFFFKDVFVYNYQLAADIIKCLYFLFSQMCEQFKKKKKTEHLKTKNTDVFYVCVLKPL